MNHVTQVVAAARAAQPAWGARPLSERVAVISAFRRGLFAERQQAAMAVSRETGKPLPESTVAEVAMVLDGARFLARVAPRILRPRKLRSATLAFWRKRVTLHHEPYGVVAVVSPWNYPLLFTAMHVLPALVAGNAVVLKPSEHTPAAADLLERLLREAGLPPGVFHVVHGDGTEGSALVNAEIDKVFFTGSERTGRRIAEACAPRFIPVSLELGSSDAAVVLDDAELDITVSGIAWGRFANAGQTCVAPKRVIVVDAVHDEFVARMRKAVEQLHVGNFDTPGTDVGRMITVQQAEFLAGQLADSLAQGAVVAARRDPPAGDTTALFAPLVVLTQVTPAMRVWHEETFGPVLAVMRARDADDAVRLANSTSFGLSGSVWSRNRGRAREVARRLDAGAVAINDCVVTAGIAEVPHGGVKHSGVGRIHGEEGLLECVRTKAVVDDLLTRSRQPWWFGYGADSNDRLDAYLRLSHGRTLMERLSGIPGTIRMLLQPERPL